MSYSAFFTSGLSLPQGDFEPSAVSKPSPPVQINVHPGTPERPRVRKRRSSLTISTLPISSIKSPMRNVNESLRVALRSPREGTFLDTHTGTRTKAVRRQTPRTARFPPLPAPTLPLPMVPSTSLGFSHATSATSAPVTPTDEAHLLAATTSETIVSRLSNTNAFLWPSNPSHKPSSPPSPLPVQHSSTGSVRGPLSPSLHAGNMNVQRDTTSAKELDMGLLVEQKDVPAAEWFDDDEDMKENDMEA